MDLYVSQPAIVAALLLLVVLWAWKLHIRNCRIQLFAYQPCASPTQYDAITARSPCIRDYLDGCCPSLTDLKRAYFIPTPYLYFSLSQTAYMVINARRRDKSSDIYYERELLTSDDGGTIAIDWYPSQTSDKPDTRPVAIIMTGVGGSSKEYYIRCMAKSLADGPLNYRVVVMNHRGCGGTKLTSPKPYNAHETSDIHLTVRHAHTHYPHAPLVALAFSMGGNILTRYVGEESGDCILSAAVVISAPYDLPLCVRAMEEHNFLNDYVFRPAVVSGLKRYLLKNANTLNSGNIQFDMEQVKRARSQSELDDLITAKVFSTRDSWEYYEQASSASLIEHIKIPFLSFASRDDTLSPIAGNPLDEFKKNPNTALVVTSHGGHIGFYHGLRPRSWCIDPITEFFGAVVEPPKEARGHHVLDVLN
ncbi:hypothetical protein FBU59_000620 [Linderina macrospora]|uniref:Uncharacterized protein n=1 Tax=Linderina macrospora TaxID=4868 RepID=A0ACC1JGJ7_9FUNG|nr:hypothetical protein FBU59_000620 [Linderina macrospora]